MQKLSSKTKLIVILLISVILINQAIPTLVYSWFNDPDFKEKTDASQDDARISNIEEKINNIKDGTLKKSAEDNKELFSEYLDLRDYRGEDSSNLEEVAQKFTSEYLPFCENKESQNNPGINYKRKYEENGDYTEEYRKYLKQLAGEYYDKKSPEQQREEARSPEEKQQEEDAKKRQEEEEYIKELLEKDDEGFMKDVGWWDRIKRSIEKNCFQAIATIVTTIGDGVMNMLQGLVIEGSPTAVSVRDNNDYIKGKLEARDKDAYLIAYSGIARYRQPDHTSVEVEEVKTPEDNPKSIVEVPFIYLSPSAILGNKIPLFDINFIDTKTQIINPFLAGENGEYSDEMLNKAKERVVALEQNDIWRDRKEELEKNLDKIADNAKGENTENPAVTLQQVVAKWYIAIRDIAATGLLIVLVYIGIRILISSSGEEKAKYKIMLKDWAMGIVIVLGIHMLMLLLMNLMQIITNMISNQSLNFVEDATRWRYLHEYD